jgi:O-methyltransferase involved in polyketide biosynthesis
MVGKEEGKGPFGKLGRRLSGSVPWRTCECLCSHSGEMKKERHISESAFLVNESRARNVPLSLDRYASLWVTDGTRRLWEDFARDVYPYDDTELSLRNRFYLDVLEASIRSDPGTVFVNLAGGFTSYPFLTETPCRSLEVDFDHVCRLKRRRIEEWRREGVLPEREVEFIPCDFQNVRDIKRLGTALRNRLGTAPSAAFFEGITYYLDRTVLLRLFGLLRDVQRPKSVIALDFWTPDAATHPVHLRFKKFFADRFGHGQSDYNLFDVGFLKSIDGYEIVDLTDIVELEKRYTKERILTRLEEILPEHYAVLRRRRERS